MGRGIAGLCVSSGTENESRLARSGTQGHPPVLRDLGYLNCRLLGAPRHLPTSIHNTTLIDRMEYQGFQSAYTDPNYGDDMYDHHYAGSRYVTASTLCISLTISSGDQKIDPSLLGETEESDPARRKRQKFNRSRTACHPVCLLMWDVLTIVPDQEG